MKSEVATSYVSVTLSDHTGAVISIKNGTPPPKGNMFINGSHSVWSGLARAAKMFTQKLAKIAMAKVIHIL